MAYYGQTFHLQVVLSLHGGVRHRGYTLENVEDMSGPNDWVQSVLARNSVDCFPSPSFVIVIQQPCSST
jgi:hypothetical protein